MKEKNQVNSDKFSKRELIFQIRNPLNSRVGLN